MAELKRTLGLGEIIFFASGVILGAGIYTIVGKAAGLAGYMLWASLLISAATALLSVLSYAELSAMYPKAGGEYAYVKEAGGQKLSYGIGAIVSLSGMLGAATISIGFAGYLASLVPLNERLASLLIIALIFVINSLGIKHSSVFNIIFTLVEAGGLLFVIFSALPQFGSVNYFEAPEGGMVGILSAAALSFFAFTGFEDTAKLAEEAKSPEKNIPKALLISGLIVSLLYLCITLMAVSAVDPQELSQSESPLATIIEKRFGRTGALVLSVIALFSTSNSLLSNMLGASRVLYNMGRDSGKISWLGRLSSRKTPVLALCVAALVAAAVSLIGNIEHVAMMANFCVFTAFTAMNITVIYLRVKEKDTERPFRIPVNIGNIPVASILALGLLLVMLSFTVYNLAV